MPHHSLNRPQQPFLPSPHSAVDNKLIRNNMSANNRGLTSHNIRRTLEMQRVQYASNQHGYEEYREREHDNHYRTSAAQNNGAGGLHHDAKENLFRERIDTHRNTTEVNLLNTMQQFDRPNSNGHPSSLPFEGEHAHRYRLPISRNLPDPQNRRLEDVQRGPDSQNGYTQDFLKARNFSPNGEHLSNQALELRGRSARTSQMVENDGVPPCHDISMRALPSCDEERSQGQGQGQGEGQDQKTIISNVREHMNRSSSSSSVYNTKTDDKSLASIVSDENRVRIAILHIVHARCYVFLRQMLYSI